MSFFKSFSNSIFTPTHNINAQVGPVRVNRVAEKLGGLIGGEKGRKIGKKIDDLTNDVTVWL